MKVLVLTNRKHFDFIDKVVFRANSEHDVHAFYGDEPCLFHDIDYDIGVSFMYTYKVPKSELDKATWFNFHPAPLPEYKGRNLCYHAIMNGAKSFGATIHYMDEGFDTGDIIDTLDFPVDQSWTAQDLHDKTMEASKTLFKRFFPMILTGREFGCTANKGGTYYKKKEIEDTVTLAEQAFIGQFVRAVTYGDFYPKIDIGGVKYKIVRDE